MATPEEKQRQIAEGLVGRAAKGRSAVERLQLEIQSLVGQRRAKLESDLRAELEAREGIVGDFMNDEELRPIWDAAVVGNPAEGIAPTFDQQAKSEAMTQIDTARIEGGLPSIQNTVVAWQQAEQQAAPHKQAVAESQFVETDEQAAVRTEEEDFQRMVKARDAFQEQVVKPGAERNARVIAEVEAAMSGDEQSIEAFTQKIESMEDGKLRDETIQLAQRAGMDFGRPVKLMGADRSDEGGQTVEYPAQDFNSPQAVAFRGGITQSAAQFAQGDAAPVGPDGQPVAAPVAGPDGGAAPSGGIVQGAVNARDEVVDFLDSEAGKDTSALGLVGDVGGEILGNIAATPGAIVNMLTRPGAGTLGEEVGKVREGGGSVFNTAGETIGPVVQQMGESAGDFFSENFLPDSTQKRAMDADTARNMAELQNRPGPAHRPGGIFYDDPNAVRTVPAEPLGDEEIAAFLDSEVRTVPAETLAPDELAAFAVEQEADLLTQEFNANPNQNRHKNPNLSARQKKLLADDEAFANSLRR